MGRVVFCNRLCLTEDKNVSAVRHRGSEAEAKAGGRLQEYKLAFRVEAGGILATLFLCGAPQLWAQDKAITRGQPDAQLPGQNSEADPPTMFPHPESDRWWISGQANFISQCIRHFTRPIKVHGACLRKRRMRLRESSRFSRACDSRTERNCSATFMKLAAMALVRLSVWRVLRTWISCGILT